MNELKFVLRKVGSGYEIAHIGRDGKPKDWRSASVSHQYWNNVVRVTSSQKGNFPGMEFKFVEDSVEYFHNGTRTVKMSCDILGVRMDISSNTQVSQFSMEWHHAPEWFKVSMQEQYDRSKSEAKARQEFEKNQALETADKEALVIEERATNGDKDVVHNLRIIGTRGKKSREAALQWFVDKAYFRRYCYSETFASELSDRIYKLVERRKADRLLVCQRCGPLVEGDRVVTEPNFGRAIHDGCGGWVNSDSVNYLSKVISMSDLRRLQSCQESIDGKKP